MMPSHIRRVLYRLAIALIGVATSSGAIPVRAQSGDPAVRAQAQADTPYALARDAYLFAYPIVTMDTTMRQVTNVPDAITTPMRAPVNRFAHARAYPDANRREVVRFNFDTLYSSAWVDVSAEPVVLSVPDTSGRYYLLQMLDMWTDVFATVGKRTTGTKAGNFALVAPGWNGTLPDGIEKIVAPTSMFWILGRTQTNGPADYSNVHKVQDGYKIVPLSQWGRAPEAPQAAATDSSVDSRTPPQTQVNRLDGVAMLTRLASLMSKYPPHSNDYPILFRLRALGLEPGKSFDVSRLDASAIDTINTAAKDARDELAPAMRRMGRVVNGWNIATENVGTYGTSYKQRAMIALGGLGANLPEDAVYPAAFVDASGQALSGANRYVLHFDSGKLPPAAAFWSITVYDKDGFQVPNAINRFAIGDRDKLAFNADGSRDIYLQADSPGKDKESNWLPAPRDVAFAPTMRIYSPQPSVMDGTWSPPPLQRTDAMDNRPVKLESAPTQQ
jgi:hypothetical protein